MKRFMRKAWQLVTAFFAGYIIASSVGAGFWKSLFVALVVVVVFFAVAIWDAWPTDDEMEELNPGYKQRMKDEPVSQREEPVPKPLSPELTELAEKIRKKLK